MNISCCRAEEQTLCHTQWPLRIRSATFRALDCCTTLVNEEKKKKLSWLFSLFKHYNTHNSLGVKTCSWFSQICFFFSADDFLRFLSNLVFGSSVTLQNVGVEILKVVYIWRNVAVYLQILWKGIFLFSVHIGYLYLLQLCTVKCSLF